MSSLAAQAWALAFGGLSVEEGLALREAAEPRHFPTNDPARFGDLLSVADLDAFLRTDGAASPRVSMADGARAGSAAVPEHEYAREDGRIDLSRLHRRFDQGATLVVSQFQEAHAPLARFCRGLEKVFLHPVQSNIYLTPPGAQGFRVHFDTHDVLVLQVEGEKRWRLWDTQPLRFPTRRTPWEAGGVAIPEETPRELVLKAGEALYVPRGVLHDAASQEGHSLHITVGLLEPSFADLVRLMTDMAEKEETSLREPFPVWRLGEADGVARFLEAARARLARVGQDRFLELASLAFLDRLAAERAALPARGLFAPPPEPGDSLRLADGVHYHVVPDGEGAQLRWAGGVEKIAPRELAWLERLDRGARPSELGGEDALAFCRRLFAAGLLTRAKDGA